MSGSRTVALLTGALALLASAAAQSLPVAAAAIECDADSDCFCVPGSADSAELPVLVVLHCNGAVRADLDSLRLVSDSLGWILVSCHASRNHRSLYENDTDILRTLEKLRSRCRVDSSRVFIYGFSGQGVQALATMFLHPELFRGAAAVCAHRGGLVHAVWETLVDHCVYLVTRAQDWNRAENEMMYRMLNDCGLTTELLTTVGEHAPGTGEEVLAACRWLAGMTAAER